MTFMKTKNNTLLWATLCVALSALSVPAAQKRGPAGTSPAFKGPVGLQLYSLRDSFAKDVPGTLDKAAALGFNYVELAGTYNLPPEKFRNLLRENWGKTDTEDALGCAQALADQGLADRGRIVIKGGSAGGFTVLNVLAHHPGAFKAGASLFGVSSLFGLATDTHKFEQRYLDTMVGPLPAAAARYHAWSPIYHAAGIRDPLAVFQGKEDKVVPYVQSEEIVAALRKNGTPHIYTLYEGEGHGWRKIETIIDYLQQLERFLQQQVLFSA